MVVANPGESARHHGAGIRSDATVRYLVRDIEPVHVQEVVEHTQMFADVVLQIELDHQIGEIRPDPPRLDHVRLVDFVQHLACKQNGLQRGVDNAKGRSGTIRVVRPRGHVSKTHICTNPVPTVVSTDGDFDSPTSCPTYP